MPTLDAPETIKTMLENAGVCPGYPKALQIAAYYHKVSNTTRYHVAYGSIDIDDLHKSPFVGTVKVLWQQEGGLTQAGRDFLAGKVVL
jgi:hypothetical protein